MDERLEQLFTESSRDIGKQDILQLVAVAIKENQPIGQLFARTILADIQKKLKDIKIKSTPIEIDGKSISKEINKSISDGVSENIDSTVNDINKRVSAVGKQVTADSAKSPLTLSSLLGQTPQMSAYTRAKYQGLARNILDKIEKGLPSKLEFSKEGVDISAIMGTSRSAGLRTQLKWGSVQRTILDKISKGVEGAKFNIPEEVQFTEIMGTPRSAGLRTQLKWGSIQRAILDKISEGIEGTKFSIPEEVKFNEIMGMPRSAGILTQLKWGSVQRSVLDKISGGIKDTKLSIPEEVKFNEIMGMPRSAGILTQLKWGSVQRSVLDKVEKGVKRSKFTIPEEVKFNEIMGETQNAGLLTKLKWGSVQRSILDKIEKGLKRSKFTIPEEITLSDIMGETPKTGLLTQLKWGSLQRKILEKVSKASDSETSTSVFGKNKDSGDGEPAKFKSLEETKPIPVELAAISKSMLVSLGILLGKKAGDESKEEPAPKTPSWLSKFLGPLALVVGGIGALITGLLSTGPLKGLLTMIGKGGIMAGLNMIIKKIGPKLLKGLRFIPFVGSIIDFADAFMRFKQSDYVGGTLSLIGGLAGLIPGAGPWLSFGVSALNALLDYKAGGAGKEKNVAKLDILKNMAISIGKFIMKGARHLPIIGTAIQLYESYTKFKSGDLGGGLLSMVGGLATLIPGFGPLVSAGVGILANFLEKTAAAQSTEGRKVTTFDVMKGFIVPIKDRVMKWLKGTSIYQLGSGIYDIFTGDVVGGFGKIAGVLSNVPIIGPAFSMLNSWVGAANEKVESGAASGKPISLFQAVKNVIFDKIKKGLKHLPPLLRQAMKFIPGLGELIGTDNTEEPDTSISSSSAKPKPSMSKDVAQDFIWRKGQPTQKFSSNDNILATKDEKKFNQMLDVMNGTSKNSTDSNQKMMQLHSDINKLIIVMNNVMKKISESNNKAPVAVPVQQTASLPGISEDAGTVRDPAYILRSRAWDRIRKGYVVI